MARDRFATHHRQLADRMTIVFRRQGRTFTPQAQGIDCQLLPTRQDSQSLPPMRLGGIE